MKHSWIKKISKFNESVLLKISLFSKQTLLRYFPADGLQSLREAMVWTLPCAMMSAIFIATAFVLDILQVAATLSVTLKALSGMISALIPIVTTSSLAYILSIKKRLPPMPVSLLALICALVIHWELTRSFKAALPFVFLIGILVPFVVVPLVKSMSEKKWTMITNNDFAGNNVKGAINLTVPGIVVFLVVFCGLKFFVYLGSFIDHGALLSNTAISASYFGGALYAVLNSVLWFFGIHGANVLQPLIAHLDELSSAGFGAVNQSFLGAFVFIGGSGATLSLILSILVFSKNKTLRLLAFASIPIGLLNVNELLLFGLPIILNPKMVVPFVITPLANVFVALTAVHLGWVQAPDALSPLNSLIGLNAYVSTHDWNAVYLQVFNVVMGMFIYSAFVKKLI